MMFLVSTLIVTLLRQQFVLVCCSCAWLLICLYSQSWHFVDMNNRQSLLHSMGQWYSGTSPYHKHLTALYINRNQKKLLHQENHEKCAGWVYHNCNQQNLTFAWSHQHCSCIAVYIYINWRSLDRVLWQKYCAKIPHIFHILLQYIIYCLLTQFWLIKATCFQMLRRMMFQ